MAGAPKASGSPKTRGRRPRGLRITSKDALAVAEALDRRTKGRSDLLAELGLEALPTFAARLRKAARRRRSGAGGPDSEIQIALIPEAEVKAADRVVEALLVAAPGALEDHEVDGFLALQIALTENLVGRGRRGRPLLEREQLMARADRDVAFGGDEFSRSRMERRYKQVLRELDLMKDASQAEATRWLAEAEDLRRNLRLTLPISMQRLLLVPDELNLS